MMDKAHRWLWSTFGGSAMLWDVALGVLAGVALVCLCVLAVFVLLWLSAKVLEEMPLPERPLWVYVIAVCSIAALVLIFRRILDISN